MSRFSDIKRGTQLNQALTRYTQYLTTARTPRVNSRGARPAQKACGVIPFDLDLGAGEVIQVNSPLDGVNRLASVINANTGSEVFIDAALTSATAVSRAGFKPARVVTNENATRSVTVGTSDITGQQYLKYTSDRFACAFGRQSDAATGKMIEVFDELKTTLKARTGLAVNRVSLTPEKYTYR